MSKPLRPGDLPSPKRSPGATPAGGRVLAVLGPTNTGKTHLAVERMLGHRTGMMGLPLRLLAREIYDRVADSIGARHVALITGEERIVPNHPRYFVCTVESMPLQSRVEFLAVDEIQLLADRDRGHIFTDRLLYARGDSETMFLGADTVRPLLRRLLPDAEVISRPRFSDLRHSGVRKLARLPRRSAIVGFSAAEVYALAELMRRHRGGAAVVLGALSPRTRNAQVALYQAGEVDYLVATDAIGMGLNLNVDHIAFASLRKFDGVGVRGLTASEIGQIAGRAGRHMNDGSFGTTAGEPAMEAELAQAIEGHRFDPIPRAQWRSGNLRFSSAPALLHSLTAASPRPELVRAPEAADVVALRALVRDAAIADMAHGRAALRRLWEVCQIPDFRKSMPEVHHRLLARIYRHLMGQSGVLPTDWIARHVSRLDNTDGDVDALAHRIAHVRTWTYVANRGDWLEDPQHWRGETRALEDRLSDALHARLTRRFVDRRTAALVRGLRADRRLFGAVTGEGEVLVEGQFVGRLRGLRFAPDASQSGRDARAVRTAANRVLAREIVNQAAKLAAAPDDAIDWREDNRLWWSGASVARLERGPDPLRPAIALLPTEHLSGPLRERVRRRLADWLAARLRHDLAPLVRLRDAELTGSGRGLAFHLVEGLGTVERSETVADLIDGMETADRSALGGLGVRLGYVDVFLPRLFGGAAVECRGRLWAAWSGIDPPPPPPPPERVSVLVEATADTGHLRACGYRRIGNRAVRIDMLDRLADQARRNTRKGRLEPDHRLLSLVGVGRDELAGVLKVLGYRPDGESFRYVRRRPGRAARREAGGSSPFSALRSLRESWR